MEEKVIMPFYHNHPLILKQHIRKEEKVESCFGCGIPLADLEMSYVCMEDDDCRDRYYGSSNRVILHKKCGELPTEIRNPKHPQHPLLLSYFPLWKGRSCDGCGRDLDYVLGYRCNSCDFNLEVECEKISIDALLEVEKREVHPSHLDHPLTLMRKRPYSFLCDGCGVEDVDMAYICSTCEFWVHKSCATSLPPLLQPTNHHHPLSLAFSFPNEHRNHKYKCEECDKGFGRTYWVYYCGICRYFVHIKCIVGLSTPDYSNLSEDGVVEFPLHANDISTKLITPFVTMMRESDVETTSTGRDSILLEYYHEHPLSFVAEPTIQQQEEEEEGGGGGGGGGGGELKVCDVCVTPISNSTPYYECAACTYSIHSICSSLPPALLPSSSSSHSHPLYADCNYSPNKNHNFTLYKSTVMDGAISYWYCSFCHCSTNGMGYECGDCGKKIDVKCASLPNAIRHLSHTRHHHEPLLLTRISRGEYSVGKRCHGCKSDISYYGNIAYCCSHDGCDFALDIHCALLPLSITEREWDKHPLLLTFDASLDHPSDFYCEFCEEEMHPKDWMYHCRQCDASFHTHCLNTGSGFYRNVKLGRRYEMDGIHPNHPLTFTCVTLKSHCDLCGTYVFAHLGFECALCYYVVCYHCGVKQLENKKRFIFC